jgi:hypothetical protein
VQVVGAGIEVRIDGATVLSVTLSAADQTTFGANTWQGLVATGAGSERIDDVLVTRWP